MVRQCIQSCARQDYPRTEIVVIINPADLNSESAVLEAAPAARIIRTHKNLGFFPALNIALANTVAEYVMIIDDDAWFLFDDALSRLIAEFRKEPTLGAVTCNLEGPQESPITGGDQFIRAFTTGFTMMPRKVVTEWVSYFPDVFFRSAGETFLCTLLWEQCRPIKRVEGVRMYHALAMEGRSTRDWIFFGLRSQILCAVMREPTAWLLPVLASKFVKTVALSVRTRRLLLCLSAWCSALFWLPEALRWRRPVSYSTRRLLMRLGKRPVHDLASLPEWRAVVAAATKVV
jgi:GT2 family glycosyltransferase